MALPLPLIRRLYEAGVAALFAVVLLRSWRARGSKTTLREIAFGFALSQGVELLAVSDGRYRYPGWLVYFPPIPAWVPLGVGLGWAALVPNVMGLSDRLLGVRSALWKRAALDGTIAVGLDLVLDPAVSGAPLAMWTWRGEGMTPYRFWILDVPLFNFVGWFLLVGACGWQLRLAQSQEHVWRSLAGFLAVDLAIAAVVMRLPW